MRLCLHEKEEINMGEEEENGEEKEEKINSLPKHLLRFSFLSNHVVDIDNDIDGIEFD